MPPREPAQGLAVHGQDSAPPDRPGSPCTTAARTGRSPASNRSASTRPISRRIVDSDGHRRSVPSATAAASGRSATHSATATNDRAPAATAHTAAVSTTTNSWRCVDRPRRHTAQRIGQPRRPHRIEWLDLTYLTYVVVAMAAIDNDAGAGTALFRFFR